MLRDWQCALKQQKNLVGTVSVEFGVSCLPSHWKSRIFMVFGCFLVCAGLFCATQIVWQCLTVSGVFFFGCSVVMHGHCGTKWASARSEALLGAFRIMLSSEDRCLLAYRYVMIRDDTRGIIKMLEFVFWDNFGKFRTDMGDSGRFWGILVPGVLRGFQGKKLA